MSLPLCNEVALRAARKGLLGVFDIVVVAEFAGAVLECKGGCLFFAGGKPDADNGNEPKGKVEDAGSFWGDFNHAINNFLIPGHLCKRLKLWCQLRSFVKRAQNGCI